MSERADHLLKTIWLMHEKCVVDSESILSQVPMQVRATAKMLERNGLISAKNGQIRLLPKGHKKAESLIRRHLLAERLLSDVFQVSDKEMAKSACAFEHILSPEVTDSVCTFLGHPPVCPHGIAIPRGRCCAKFTKDVKPVVHRLLDMEIGEKAKIVFIAPGRNKTLDRLAIFGVVPGNQVRLEQKRPAYVIQVDETVLALEADLCEGIYVKNLNGAET
ncbi:metal-dependent transcriptional regulator [candidate division KSB1 bacterium]|nr:metal-dependent transcriptional regulator [candidate division KSB1 bacterium]NIR71214.1 metal-dependent transcriptional regulator [candidate division KSB1 bacterium]NIS23318.1 metal-dependent transcriptional regulator [candidate division KSB1 bacterium]NIT70197.1 metal-dependent transcriptional regulator [candidate division KSB1 bacterium]NIU23849.1 metal-dependent transcriptional regulator [candidate division KSB1 bacterium]